MCRPSTELPQMAIKSDQNAKRVWRRISCSFLKIQQVATTTPAVATAVASRAAARGASELLLDEELLSSLELELELELELASSPHANVSPEPVQVISPHSRTLKPSPSGLRIVAQFSSLLNAH